MNDMKNIPAWAGEKPSIPESVIQDVQTTDVLVLGGGNAGVQCALASAGLCTISGACSNSL